MAGKAAGLEESAARSSGGWPGPTRAGVTRMPSCCAALRVQARFACCVQLCEQAAELEESAARSKVVAGAREAGESVGAKEPAAGGEGWLAGEVLARWERGCTCPAHSSCQNLRRDRAQLQLQRPQRKTVVLRWRTLCREWPLAVRVATSSRVVGSLGWRWRGDGLGDSSRAAIVVDY